MTVAKITVEVAIEHEDPAEVAEEVLEDLLYALSGIESRVDGVLYTEAEITGMTED